MTTRLWIDMLVIVPLALFILLTEWAKQNPPEDEGGGSASTDKAEGMR
jgi:hypothetical protein